VFLVLAGTGLGVDLSRIFLAHAELETHAEAGALAASHVLTGGAGSLETAREAAAAEPLFERIDFAESPRGPWTDKPSPGVRWVRVTTHRDVPLTLLRVVVFRPAVPVRASIVLEGGPR
jgi:Flp pilus assembly protein TadG